MQVYIEFAKKGYDIAQKGLAVIGDVKNGELNLHSDYFNSLKNVHPKIKNDAKVAAIIDLQLKIVQFYNRAYNRLQQSKAFSQEELNYIYRVYGRLLEDCSQEIDELIAVTTNGNLEMKDDERIKIVDALYHEMQDHYTFIQSFSNEALTLAYSRIKAEKDIQNSRSVNGLKNE